MKYVLISLLTLTGFSVKAEEAPPPAILEAFQCSFIAGKDRDDLMAARDYYLKQAQKAGIEPESAYVWWLYKGQVPFDFVWFNLHANLGAFGASADQGAASSEMAGVRDRFYSVANCSSGISVVMPVFQRVAPGEAAPNLISSSACQLRRGAGPDDVDDLRGHINDVMTSMGDNSPLFAFMIDPITGGPNAADVFLVAVSDSVSGWTTFAGGLGTPAGAQLGRHLNSVLECELSLWNGEQVVGNSG
jgi:hypothetical protein